MTHCLRIHTECGSRLGGVSLEFTGELSEDGFSVTECLGGSMELSEEELGLRYQVHDFVNYLCHRPADRLGAQSFCDPRLNFEQSLGVPFSCYYQLFHKRPHSDIAFLMSDYFKKERRITVQEGGLSNILHQEFKQQLS